MWTQSVICIRQEWDCMIEYTFILFSIIIGELCNLTYVWDTWPRFFAAWEDLSYFSIYPKPQWSVYIKVYIFLLKTKLLPHRRTGNNCSYNRIYIVSSFYLSIQHSLSFSLSLFLSRAITKLYWEVGNSWSLPSPQVSLIEGALVNIYLIAFVEILAFYLTTLFI